MNKLLAASGAVFLALAVGVMPTAAAEWTGIYVGVNAGYAAGQSDANTSTVYSSSGYFATTSVPAIAATGSQSLNSGGFTGGAQAGYNWQADDLLFGFELDFGGLDLRDTKTGTAAYPCCSTTAFTIRQSRTTDWLFTARPRLGWLVNDLLFYATGGLAMTKLAYKEKFTDTYATALETGSIDKTKVGWTVGAGVEAQVYAQWTLKGEYLYADFGSASTTSTNLTAYNPAVAYPTNIFTHAINLSAHIFRVGANYHF